MLFDISSCKLRNTRSLFSSPRLSSVLLWGLPAVGLLSTCAIAKPIAGPSVRVDNGRNNTSTAMDGTANDGPMRARRTQFEEVLHGVTIADPYRWLEDASDPRVAQWVSEQDLYAREQLRQVPERAGLAERLKELVFVEERSAPIERGGRLFYWTKSATAEKATRYWEEGSSRTARTLLDTRTPHNKGNSSVANLEPSWDGKYVSYSVSSNNRDHSDIAIMEVDTGHLLEKDTIRGVLIRHVAWAPDSRGFYYTWTPNDSSESPGQLAAKCEIRFHLLGTSPHKDQTILGDTGRPSTWRQADVTDDGQYLIVRARVSLASGFTDDVYFSRMQPGQGQLRRLVTGSGQQCRVTGYGDRLYVLTNHGASNYRVMAVDPRKPQQDAWTEIVPQDSGSVIDGLKIVAGRLVIHRRRWAYSELEVRELNGPLVQRISLPSKGEVSAMVGNATGGRLLFNFESFGHPRDILALDVANGDVVPFWRSELPIDRSLVQVDHFWFKSKDGTKVPLFLGHRRDLQTSKSNPLLLIGYGAYGTSWAPYFSPRLYLWIERGGVVALVNPRGGGELGEDWHRQGMLANKPNSFDDFISASEWLIENGFTQASRLGIWGGSFGGLLVGAALTQRPDLYGGVLCAVPIADLLRFHLFGRGSVWTAEFGNPEDPEHFDWLRAYSPYQRIERGTAYPPVLTLSADSDDRVDPMHARKFVAALQWAQTAPNPVLLRVQRNAGHFGADSRTAWIDETADELAFLYRHLGPPSNTRSDADE